MRILLLYFVILIVHPNGWAAEPISDLRAAVSRQNFTEAARIARQLYASYRVDLSPDGQRLLAQENGQLVKNPSSVEDLTKLIHQLEASLSDPDKEIRHRKAGQIVLIAFRLEQSQGPGAAELLRKAREQARSDPSFSNYYALALRANMAKEYSAAIEAANHALRLRGSDRLASTAPEGAHAVATLAANASFELGKLQDAEQYLLDSLSTDNQRWVRACPDWFVAEKLLAVGRREGVVKYFEKAYTQAFPKCQQSITFWLADLKAGKNPKFAAPSKN